MAARRLALGSLCAIVSCATSAEVPVVCDIVKQCESAQTHIEKLECASKAVYRNTLDDPHGFVVHSNGQGWGNTVRSVVTVLPFSATLGRPMILDVAYYKRAFLPPDGSTEWLKPPPYNMFAPETRALFDSINTVLEPNDTREVRI